MLSSIPGLDPRGVNEIWAGSDTSMLDLANGAHSEQAARELVEKLSKEGAKTSASFGSLSAGCQRWTAELASSLMSALQVHASAFSCSHRLPRRVSRV